MSAFLVALICAGPVAAEPSLDHRLVTFRVVAWDIPGELLFDGHGETVKVSEDVEFGLRREGAQNSLDVVPVIVNISATRIELDYSANAPGTFADLAFNGYELSFPGGCALIREAHIDTEATTLALDDSAIKIEPTKLFLNVSGFDYAPTDRIAIDVKVADCPIS